MCRFNPVILILHQKRVNSTRRYLLCVKSIFVKWLNILVFPYQRVNHVPKKYFSLILMPLMMPFCLTCTLMGASCAVGQQHNHSFLVSSSFKEGFAKPTTVYFNSPLEFFPKKNHASNSLHRSCCILGELMGLTFRGWSHHLKS